MKKIIILMLLAFTLFAAYASKPDDKTCIMECVKAVWGRYTPDVAKPMYYEQFFDVTSRSVKIDDWVFLKRVQYKYKGGYATVGIGAFNKVFTRK